MTRQRKDTAAQAAVTAAMRELVALAGNQKRAAELYGIPQSMISDVINKSRMPRIETLIAMRDALHRSVDEILGLAPMDLAGRVAALERQMFGRPEDQAELARAKVETAPAIPAPPKRTEAQKKRSGR